MRRAWYVALVVCAAAGCEKKKAGEAPAAPVIPGLAGGDKAGGAATPAAPAPVVNSTLKYGDTSALWALAPPEATFGLVIADGVGPRAFEILNRGRSKLEGKPFAKKVLDQMEAWRKEQPFDVLDPAAYKTQGWDISKGLAVFGGADTSQPLLFVLPIADIATVQKSMKDFEGTIEKVGDRDVFKGKEGMCTTASGRFTCAKTLEAIDAAYKPHDSPLAAAVKALPAEARGDIEGYVDVAKTPTIAKELGELSKVGAFTTLGGALRVDHPGMNLHMWAKGTVNSLLSGFNAAPPAPELAAMTGNATTVLRGKIDPRVMLKDAPPSMPLGGADVRTDLLDQLTGDIQVVTAGKGLLAGALMFKVNDAARAKKVVVAMCAEAKKGGQLPVTNVVATEDSCAGEVSLAMLKDSIGAELPPFKFHFSVAGSLFLVVLGDLDPASLKGSVVDEAGSPEAKAALSGPQSAVLWTRGLGIDLSALPKELADKVAAEKELSEGLALLNWSGAQLYDVSLAAALTPTGATLTVHMTSMEADAPDARAAYGAALDKRFSGDRAGATAAMAEIEQKFPGSLAARRAKLERTGTPIVGPITGIVAAGAGAFFAMARGIGNAPAGNAPEPGTAAEPGATPPAGGSFGEPAAKPGADTPPPPPPPAPEAKPNP